MGIIHYFDWAIFNSYVNVYQRVFELIGIWGGFTEFAEIGGDVTETIGIKRGQIWILYIYIWWEQHVFMVSWMVKVEFN